MNRPLRIGVDARELLGQTTGVGRYLGELLRRWTVRPDAAARQFILYAPEAISMGGGERGSETVTTRVLPGGRGTLWEQTALRRAARRDRLDAFFAPAYTAPAGLGIPFAVTIHDISFLAQPRWFRPRERWRRRILTTYAARHAAVVFTDSQFSREEIERHMAVEPARVVVIPPGVARMGDPGESIVSPAPNRGPRIANRELRRPLVLYVGSLFNRRRLPDLIAAFARAARAIPDARLVIVGADRTWPRQDLREVAAAHHVASQVEVCEYVDQAELARLYGQASVFAFLSEYEGFGLTPLEALSAHVPIVVLDTPVAREVYGPAATYVSRDIDATAAALERLLTSPEAAAGQLSHAADVLRRYSWDVAAGETLRHLDRVARIHPAR